uniref:Uncharacterized protein n=1 Tax=Tanacetum cinerariifolium TaxID=118510 RepID=A0A699GL32_TANCI|nr:hypothetical protein [Tanacetum cinerariifolium]
MALPPKDQRHQYLRFEGLQYIDADIVDFETMLGKIYRRKRRLFEIKGSLVHELILEFFSTFRFGEAMLNLDTVGALNFYLGGVRCRMSWKEFILGMGLYTAKEINPFLIRDLILRLCHRLIACSIARSQASEKVTVTDLFYLRGMDVSSVNIPYLLARTIAQWLGRLEEEVYQIRRLLGKQRYVLDSTACDFSRFTTLTVVGLSQMMSQTEVMYTSYADFHISYKRCTMRRTNDASTSTA